MRRHLSTILGAATGILLALFLLLAPADRESLFLDGVEHGATTAWQEVLIAAGGSGTTSPAHLAAVEIAPEFLAAHVVDADGARARADQLRRDPAAGRDPERTIRHRVRQALLAAREEGASDALTVTWPDEPAPAGARPARLRIEPRFAANLDGTELRLELALEGSAERYRGTGAHAWPRASSLWPPLLAIALAVLLRRTIPALLAGVLLGSWLVAAGTAGLLERGEETLRWFGAELLVQRVFLDQFRVEILLFVVFLGMAVGVMSRAGGIHGMVALLARFARGPRSTQLVSYACGVLIFFDDYANCLILGNTMRPLADRRGVSREKLSYIVDSTAAPVAAISIFSTWIAYEISMFAPQLSQANPLWTEAQGFEIFLRTIPYRFYCLLTLVFIPLTVLLRRELGPMLRAERRARHLGQPIAPGARPMIDVHGASLEPKHPERARARHAILPLVALVLVTLGMLLWSGRAGDVPGADWATRFRGVLNEADSTNAILVGSCACFALALLLALAERSLDLRDAAWASLRSVQSLVFAFAILILAWSIGAVCDELETASYLVAVSRDWIAPELLPAILFATACLISFAIGSSWSTMAILLPNVVVLAWILGERSALGPEGLLVLSIGAVLEGSIFGDHCSPISDTTVLSSVATASDHLAHVKTQAPYAILVMVVTLAVGYLPVAYLGLSPWLCMGIGILALAGILLTLGADPADPTPEEVRA